MTAHWQFDQSLSDRTANLFHAQLYGTEKYATLSSTIKTGSGSLYLDGNTFVQLPYQVASSDELTIAFWVRWMGGNNGDGQRLFDFGYDDSHCLYLTPAEKNKMRLVLRNGNSEQVLETARLGSTWRHVAVTFGTDTVRIYVNGAVVAASDNSSLFALRSSFSVLNYLGRSQQGNSIGLKGYLDDFRIYNYALPATTIASIARAIREDVNNDGVVDTQDVLAVYEYMHLPLGETGEGFDVNADGTVDTQDILCIYQYISSH